MRYGFENTKLEIQTGKYKSNKYKSGSTNRKIQIGKYKADNTSQGIHIGNPARELDLFVFDILCQYTRAERRGFGAQAPKPQRRNVGCATDAAPQDITHERYIRKDFCCERIVA